MNITRFLADIIAPERCLICTVPGVVVCKPCARRLPPARTHASPWIWNRFDYRDPNVRMLLIHLKGHPIRSLARFLARELAPIVVEELGDRHMFGNWDQEFLIVPIPIDRRRFLKYGFNQAGLLGRELARAGYGARYADILRKTKHTPKQALLSDRQKRIRNMSGAYEVKRKTKLTTHSVIVIDDISTTGATLAEAKRALKAAGFRNVIGVTVGH